MPPTYDYRCSGCNHTFDEVRGIKDYSDNPHTVCPQCASHCGPGERDFSKSKHQFVGTKVNDAEFNPGLGCIVKNKHHKDEICRQKGVIEVGNDFSGGENMQKIYDKKKKEELESAWQKEPSSFSI